MILIDAVNSAGGIAIAASRDPDVGISIGSSKVVDDFLDRDGLASWMLVVGSNIIDDILEKELEYIHIFLLMSSIMHFTPQAR
ncbi:uncharacterized protein A4U43_C08F17190 [Asparagus officinalis]|nr:uncharacterized protein A4U43_C08F17190 [Asparagus officinalis]